MAITLKLACDQQQGFQSTRQHFEPPAMSGQVGHLVRQVDSAVGIGLILLFDDGSFRGPKRPVCSLFERCKRENLRVLPAFFRGANPTLKVRFEPRKIVLETDSSSTDAILAQRLAEKG